MIYFAQPTDGGPVKIGCSDDVDARHKQLEIHYGRPLVILATMEGDEEKEAEIHARFAHLRFGRSGRRGRLPEQFRPDPELMEFIGRPLFVSAGDVDAMVPASFDPNRDDVTVKVDRTLVGKAKLIATHQGVSVAELFTELLRGPLDKAYAQMLRELEKGSGSK